MEDGFYKILRRLLTAIGLFDKTAMTSNRPSPDSKSPMSTREKIHEIIFGAETPAGALFDILLLVAIVLSVIVISLETVKTDGMKPWSDTLYRIHWFFTILFTVEYFLRVFCVRRPLAYIFSFWGIIDLLSVLPDYLLLASGLAGRTSLFSVIRSLSCLLYTSPSPRDRG